MKFALCNEIMKEFEIEKQFEVAAEIGFDALEIAPFTLNDWVQEITEEQKQRIRKASEDTGVAAAGIHWLLVGPTGLHITDPDPDVRAKTTAYCEDLVRFGLEIGATYEVVGSPGQRERKEGITYGQCWEWFKQAMAASAQVEGAEDFKVCIEPLAVSTNNNFIFNHYEAVNRHLIHQPAANATHVRLATVVRAPRWGQVPAPRPPRPCRPPAATTSVQTPPVAAPGRSASAAP
ncbi:MAG: TIM barrel protein, partial [Armatimonadota bacterium]